MEFDTDFIKAQLQRRRDEGQLAYVASGSGVSKRTITYVLAGRVGRADTAAKLYKYLRRNMRLKSLKGAV